MLPWKMLVSNRPSRGADRNMQKGPEMDNNESDAVSEADEELDWSTIDAAILERILHNADEKLRAQFDAAQNSDQRSMTFASIMAAATAAAFGVALTAPGYSPLAVGAAASGVFFLISAILCALSAMPFGMHYPGDDPLTFLDTPGFFNGTKSQVFVREIYMKDEKIKENKKKIECALKKYKYGLYAGVGSPLFAAIISISYYLWACWVEA